MANTVSTESTFPYLVVVDSPNGDFDGAILTRTPVLLSQWQGVLDAFTAAAWEYAPSDESVAGVYGIVPLRSGFAIHWLPELDGWARGDTADTTLPDDSLGAIVIQNNPDGGAVSAISVPLADPAVVLVCQVDSDGTVFTRERMSDVVPRAFIAGEILREAIAS
jgi:hypothetical protein